MKKFLNFAQKYIQQLFSVYLWIGVILAIVADRCTKDSQMSSYCFDALVALLIIMLVTIVADIFASEENK